MKLWPFGKKSEDEPEASTPPEPTALDRLLARGCSRDEFFLLYLKLLEERIPSFAFEMTGETVARVIYPFGKEVTIYMENAWIAYSDDKEGRQDLLERHVRSVANVFEPPLTLSREHIVATIKDAEYMSKSMNGGPCMSEHLCGDLWIVYAEDSPDQITSLSRERMEAAGVAESELRRLGIANLQRILPEAERHGDGPWYLLTAGGDYTASLLLLDEMWDQFAESVDGDVVAIIPSRDVLMYTGSNSSEGISAIRTRAAETLASGNYLISGTLIVRTGGRWNVFNTN